MILRPPEAPTAKPPRSLIPMAGQVFASARLPDAIELGCPGSGLNHIIPLFIRIPDSGSTYLLPKIESSVCVSETMLPSLSITQRCVVQEGPPRPPSTSPMRSSLSV